MVQPPAPAYSTCSGAAMYRAPSSFAFKLVMVRSAPPGEPVTTSPGEVAVATTPAKHRPARSSDAATS